MASSSCPHLRDFSRNTPDHPGLHFLVGDSSFPESSLPTNSPFASAFCFASATCFACASASISYFISSSAPTKHLSHISFIAACACCSHSTSAMSLTSVCSGLQAQLLAQAASISIVSPFRQLVPSALGVGHRGLFEKSSSAPQREYLMMRTHIALGREVWSRRVVAPEGVGEVGNGKREGVWKWLGGLYSIVLFAQLRPNKAEEAGVRA